MRKIVICISFIILSSSLFAQLSEESSTWDNSDLRGKVKSVTESTYVIDSKGQRGTYAKQNVILQDEIIKNFDREGILIDQRLVSYVGGESKKWHFTYNMQRRLKEEAVYNDAGLYETVSYLYNGDKLIQKSWHKGKNKSLEKTWFYQYDTSGKLINEYWSDVSGNVAWKCIYTYDIKGNMTEKSWYVGNRMTTKWTCKYDINNNVVENAEYVNGLLREVSYNSYDNKNRLSEVNVFKNSTLDMRKVYSYNKKGNLRMEWWYDSNGKQIHRRNFDYDKANKMLSSFTWGTNSELLDKIYWTYDNNANWVQRVEYEGHLPTYTIARNISYY